MADGNIYLTISINPKLGTLSQGGGGKDVGGAGAGVGC